jgi:hypothetical protein
MSHVLGGRVVIVFRNDSTLSFVLLQIEANFPEPNTTHAAAEWND